MMDNDYIVGGVLFGIRNLITQMTWEVVADPLPGEEPTPDEQEAVEFVEQCRLDMSSSWGMILSEILTFLPYGFAPMEIVYKRRMGREADGSSQYDDGKIGWRKWALRAQDSLEKWEIDPADGGLIGMWQQNPNGPNPPMIPIEKLLLFRTTAEKANPEGRSILRNAWEAWYFKHNIQRIEGIGIERDLAGLPVAFVPPEVLLAATPDDAAILAAVKNIVTGIRQDDQAAVVWPLQYDDKNNRRYDLQLMSSGGARQFDTSQIITRYDTAIAQSMLADFMQLGHESVGSFALADSKTNMFGYALGAFADLICDIVNQHAIPRLLALNGMNPARFPILRHGDVENRKLDELRGYVKDLIQVGAITPDPTLEAHLREYADLPAQEEEYIPEPPDPEQDAKDEAAALAALQMAGAPGGQGDDAQQQPPPPPPVTEMPPSGARST